MTRTRSLALLILVVTLAACSHGGLLGATYADTIDEVKYEARKTHALFQQVYKKWDDALDQKKITPDQYDTWRMFYLGQYRPQVTKALTDMNAAQNRAQLTCEKCPLDVFRTLYQRLVALDTQLNVMTKASTEGVSGERKGTLR